MINKRLYKTSSSKEILEQSKTVYQERLHKANYVYGLIWTDMPIQIRKIRRRNSTWFNPPWSGNMQTNVAAKFLALINKWFISNAELKRKFNRITIKVSYSTTRNMNSYLVSHTKKILSNGTGNNNANCNYVRITCPLPVESPPNN